jgi:preprotein translocase subunit SecD
MNNKTTYTIERKTLMTGEVIADARRAAVDANGGSVRRADPEQPRRQAVRGDHCRQRQPPLAIVLDGKVKSAPVIRERIGGGRASITGNFDLREARDLAIVLRAGALTAPVTLQEERTVGPTLGRDSIQQGIDLVRGRRRARRAFHAGLLPWRRSARRHGAPAERRVHLAALAAFEATVTLPGIAGLVLTLGMAVDARRSDQRTHPRGAPPRENRPRCDRGRIRTCAPRNSRLQHHDVSLGIDSSFQFGSGTVKGFAVTLCIGLVTSVFTAVICTAVSVYDFRLSRRRLDHISI